MLNLKVYVVTVESIRLRLRRMLAMLALNIQAEKWNVPPGVPSVGGGLNELI